MLISRILIMNRRDKPRPRPRRSTAESRFVLESLEDRTALSVTWSGPQFAPPVRPAVEVRFDVIRAETVLNLETTALDGEQAPLPVPASSTPIQLTNLSFLPNTESAVRISSVIESAVSNAFSASGGGTAMAPFEASGGGVMAKSSPLDSPLGSFAAFASFSTTDATDLTGRAEKFVDAMTGFYDARLGDPLFPMDPPFGPGEPFGLPPWRGSLPANPDDNQTDMSLSGPMLWTENDMGLLAWMSLTQASGRSIGRGSNPVVAELALQMSPTGEVGVSSGLLYLATAGWSNLLDELSVMRKDEVLLVDQSETESDTETSSLDAGIPLSILLSGVDVPIPTDQGGVEQVAELMPLAESSLALAATLWTVRSDSRATDPGSNLPVGAGADAVDPPKLWAVFMTGVDRAFEQTFREVEVGIFSGDAGHKKSEDAQKGVGDRFEWQGPILPGAVEGLRGGKQRSARPGQSSSVDDSNKTGARASESSADSDIAQDEHAEGTSQTLKVAQHQDSEPEPVVLASTPVLWAVSISSIVAGWFWGKKRERPRRSGLGVSQYSRH